MVPSDPFMSHLQRSQKVWKLKIVLLVSKISCTFYDIFDFELWTCQISYVSMHGLLSETFLCKATLRFKTRTWYDDHENSVMHSTVVVSTGVGTSHINKGKIRVITIKRIYLTNKGCLPHVPYTETALLYVSQSALIAKVSTGPWDATPPAGSEWCLHLCQWL